MTITGRGNPTYTSRTQPAAKSKTPAATVVHRPATYKKRTPAVKRRSVRPNLLLAPGKVTRTRKTTLRKQVLRKKKLALLLPGHNEELIIATTIASAIKAGQPREDIYVVDDGSEDKTRREALKMLPRKNVLSKEKGGKARAVLSGIEQFKIEERYTWLHVADADSVFCPDYFRMYKRRLDAKKYAVAVGFVQSLRGNWISRYRAFTYTFSQQVIRRVQSWFGMISVFPGPITCFRTDIIKHLDFTANSMTEDFDLTL
ncbi:MAG TPA: glycosyltransferase family 2 protein, partial [Candidatus Saccharimonadales bacterium]